MNMCNGNVDYSVIILIILHRIEESIGEEGKRLANWDQFLVEGNGEAVDTNG